LYNTNIHVECNGIFKIRSSGIKSNTLQSFILT
jgi:hypothetical protein